MNRAVYQFAALLLGPMLLIGGCAHQAATTSPSADRLSQERPALAIEPDAPGNAKAGLSLAQIQPEPVLPKPAATQADTEPPIAALVAYARGTDALLNHLPYEAIQQFQLGLLIDPDSFALYMALGQARLVDSVQASDDALAAFEHAAALRPDDLPTHLLLGRQYLNADKAPKAIEHLRLAMLCSDYDKDIPKSAAVDFLLGRALQQQGYNQAALDQFTRVTERLANATDALRNDPDVGFLVDSPTALWFQIGELNERRHDFSEAIAAYQQVDPDASNFVVQSEIARLQARLGHQTIAMQSAIDLVERFAASSDSLELLHEIYQSFGREQDVIDALQKLQKQNPGDVAIISALADQLVAERRPEAARQLLESAAAKEPENLDLFAKLFNFHLDRGDTSSAARALIQQLAAHPDEVRETDPLWQQLINPTRKGYLRIAALQKIDVPENAMPAKLYLVARLAGELDRKSLEWSMTQRAVAMSPVFPPAYRVAAKDLAGFSLRADPDINPIRRFSTAALEKLMHDAGPNLADELRGIYESERGHVASALESFAAAYAAGNPSPDLSLEYAAALKDQHDSAMCEQVLWALVESRPRLEDGWQALYALHGDQQREPDQLKVLSRWLKADPGSVTARLLQASWFARQGQSAAAEESFQSLLQDHPADEDVLSSAQSFYRDRSETDHYIATLEKLRAAQPLNFALVAWLANLYKAQNRLADATRIVDQTRAAAGNDADSLYQTASIYEAIGQIDSSQQVLLQVLKIDPNNAEASNDLGYAWADAGKNLDQAEKMIRVAVAAEPDNQAYLDSLGWVLYKRGKFDEAAGYFTQALGPDPDSIILDHFGDDLYRAGKIDDAKKQWQQSLDHLQQEAEPGSSQTALRIAVQHKIQDATAGNKVTTAPIGSAAGTSSAGS
jgi:tetratricopeptide (TPR) repeat protein